MGAVIASVYTWVSGGGGVDLMLHTGTLDIDPNVDTELGVCTMWANNRLPTGGWLYPPNRMRRNPGDLRPW